MVKVVIITIVTIMCTGERSNVWGTRDFKNVYEEPACLRRSVSIPKIN